MFKYFMIQIKAGKNPSSHFKRAKSTRERGRKRIVMHYCLCRAKSRVTEELRIAFS